MKDYSTRDLINEIARRAVYGDDVALSAIELMDDKIDIMSRTVTNIGLMFIGIADTVEQECKDAAGRPDSRSPWAINMDGAVAASTISVRIKEVLERYG